MGETSPFAPWLERHGVVVLDGGLATELQRRGHDIDHALWSAQVLLTAPDSIRDVHRAYLSAGADCIIAASYQASLPGLAAAGLTKAESQRLLLNAVSVARKAIDEHMDATGTPSPLRPLVAASVGPYGAYLEGGAEYTGDYGVGSDVLRAFHQPRWDILAAAGADLLACETIPSLPEAVVLRGLLEASPCPAWVSFSCRDERHIADGTPIERLVELFVDCEALLALGVNCTAPRHVGGLVAGIRRASEGLRRTGATLPIVVYPNSGEVYDASQRVWTGTSEPDTLAARARDWVDRGASLIGGCCRTTPHHIRAIRQALLAV